MKKSQIGVEGAQIFVPWAKLELRVSSPSDPEPVKLALEYFLQIKMLKFEFESTSSLLEN